MTIAELIKDLAGYAEDSEKGMNETKFIISEKQILDAVKYALKSNIQEQRIVEILMHDVEYEIETVLYDDCEEYKTESEADE